MHTQCSAFATDADAEAAVRQLLADGVPGARISVVAGRMNPDHATERVGTYAGDGGPVGAYAGVAGSAADAMGSFATGAGEQRRGSFGDVDRDEIATYADGVRRVHVATHREIGQRFAEAGLDPAAAAAEVAALHQGRVVVLVGAE